MSAWLLQKNILISGSGVYAGLILAITPPYVVLLALFNASDSASFSVRCLCKQFFCWPNGSMWENDVVKVGRYGKETGKNGSMHWLSDSDKKPNWGTKIASRVCLLPRSQEVEAHNAQREGNFWKVFLLSEWHFGQEISNRKIFFGTVSSPFLVGAAHSRKPGLQETAWWIFQFSAPAWCAENGAAAFDQTILQPLEIGWLELWGSFDAVILQLPT